VLLTLVTVWLRLGAPVRLKDLFSELGIDAAEGLRRSHSFHVSLSAARAPQAA
jgi:hypothetical protein